MGTTIEDLKEWYQRGKDEKATHLIVATDTFDWEDYPVFVKKGEDVGVELTRLNGQNMQKVMEVYNLAKPFDKQHMNGRLCWDLG